MRRDARTVSEWDIQRIIMCHGVRVSFRSPRVQGVEGRLCEVSGLGANTSGFWFSSMTVNR